MGLAWALKRRSLLSLNLRVLWSNPANPFAFATCLRAYSEKLKVQTVNRNDLFIYFEFSWGCNALEPHDAAFSEESFIIHSVAQELGDANSCETSLPWTIPLVTTPGLSVKSFTSTTCFLNDMVKITIFLGPWCRKIRFHVITYGDILSKAFHFEKAYYN